MKPIIEVLVGKTVEQALLEVMEEEELSSLRAQQVQSSILNHMFSCDCCFCWCICAFSVSLRKIAMLSWLRPRDWRNKKEDVVKKRCVS